MDLEVKALLEKKIKAMSGSNYVGSKTTTDEKGEHLEITFKKQDGTLDKTTIDFPKPKDGNKGDKGDKGKDGDNGAAVVDCRIDGADIIFSLSDNNEIALDGAVNELRGAAGEDGVGVVAGGTIGQVLAKKSDTDYDTEWVDQTGGSGGVSKEYVDGEVSKKPSINDGTPTNNTTWSSQHSAEIIENIVNMANKQFERAKMVEITLAVKLPDPSFTVGEDEIQFIDNEIGNAHFTVKIKDIPDKDAFKVTLAPDLYGHFAIVRNDVEISKTTNIITTLARDEYVFVYWYADNRFVADEAYPMGTLDAIKANAVTTPQHNSLDGLQGGKSGGKGEYFHLNNEQFSKLDKLVTKGAVQASRIYTKDEAGNIANLVSQSSFSTLVGNRLVGNTLFSNFGNSLTHVFNDGNVDLYKNTTPATLISRGNYVVGIPIRDKEGTLNNVDGLKITKIGIYVKEGETSPQVGNIGIFDSDDKPLWTLFKDTDYGYLIDTYGNIDKKILFDIPEPLTVEYGTKVICKIAVESDSIMGNLDEPTIELTIEQLQEKQIAHVNEITEMAHDVYETKSELFKPTGEDNTFIIETFGDNTITSPRGEFIVPKKIKNIDFTRITETIRDDGKIVKFKADGITHLESPNLGEPLFSNNPNLTDIYLDSLVNSNMRFADSCPNLRKIYVSECNVRELFESDMGLINNCVDVTFYFDTYNGWMQKACDKFGYDYEYTNIPSSKGKEVGSCLTLSEGKLPYWSNDKVNKSDIIDNLHTAEPQKPLSANQGRELGAQITSVSEAMSNVFFKLQDHTLNKTNPHSVTATQVGLGNCNNTSDANKPVSTAQKTYIDNAVATKPSINDNVQATNSVWSSTKTAGLIATKPSIIDSGASYTSVYSSTKVNDLLALKQPITDDTLTTYNKDIPKAINELQNGLRCVTGASIQYDPLGESLTTSKPITQAQIQAYYDANKSKSGFLSQDTTNPLSIYPDLPPIPTGKYAFWLGENKWYYVVGDGTNSKWSSVNEFAKGGLNFTPVYIAIGVGQGYATKAYTDTAIANNTMRGLVFLDGDKSVLDFRTAFTQSGMYRIFNPSLNLPDASYTSKNCDFYVSCYYTSDKYQKLMVSDVRSSRMFVLTKDNGNWLPWYELGKIDDTSTTSISNSWSAKKTSDELAKKEDKTIPSNPAATELNSFSSRTENYKVGISNLISANLPTSIVSGANLVVIEGMVFKTAQRQYLYDMTSNRSWVRLYNGSSWSAWSNVTT